MKSKYKLASTFETDLKSREKDSRREKAEVRTEEICGTPPHRHIFSLKTAEQLWGMGPRKLRHWARQCSPECIWSSHPVPGHRGNPCPERPFPALVQTPWFQPLPGIATVLLRPPTRVQVG